MTDSDHSPDAMPEGGNAGQARRRPAVLVVGAGPTGLLLAAELQRRAVPCNLIDARPAALHWDRATVVHPRSLEIFESLGLVDRFLDAGCRQRSVKIHSGGRVLGTKDLSKCGSTYGFSLGLSEEVTESILTDYLHQQGGRVNRSCRLVGLTPQADGVLAEIECDGERYPVAAPWVVGCDGLHSPTRELSGIGFADHDIAQPWAVFDAALQGWAETFEANFVYLEPLPVVLTALPALRWRVYMRPSSPESDLVAEATATIRRYAPAVAFVNVENPTRFHCHTKVATKFRSGAVLLAGDAAHLCSPAEGHGMNCGLQDAFNLAWKLALVHHGTASPALLESYDAERRPVAEMIAQSGDATDHAQTMTDPTERNQRDQSIEAMLADPQKRQHEIVAEAELNVDYARSPIVFGDASGNLAPGTRLPNTIPVRRPDGQPCRLHELAHRAGHTLMLLGGRTAHAPAFVELYTALQKLTAGSPLFEAAIGLSTPPAVADQVGQIDLAGTDLLGVQGTTLFAVRPDGYLGLRSDEDHLSALERYRKLVQA